MGQYYKPCFINETKDQVLGWFECYDTNNGAKLMEHSYVGNSLCKNVAFHMVKSPKRLVWCGDYADEVFDGQNYYDQCDDRTKIHSVDGDSLDNTLNANTIYINHDKKEWFDLTKQVTPVCSDWDGKVHPLPLLTADGNGRGGGDYDGVLMDMVGRWKGVWLRFPMRFQPITARLNLGSLNKRKISDTRFIDGRDENSRQFFMSRKLTM